MPRQAGQAGQAQPEPRNEVVAKDGRVIGTIKSSKIYRNRGNIKDAYVVSGATSRTEFYDTYFVGGSHDKAPYKRTFDAKVRERGEEVEKLKAEAEKEAKEEVKGQRVEERKGVLNKADLARRKGIEHVAEILIDGTRTKDDNGKDIPLDARLSQRSTIEALDYLRKEVGYSVETLEEARKLDEDSPLIKEAKAKGILPANRRG